MEVEPEKNATCVAVPEPDIVAVPVVSVSDAQYQADIDEFHLSIWVLEHPPRSLRPEVVTSSPELFDVTEVVPVVSESIVILSAERVIPLPAPIFIVVAPGPVPHVSPDPAVSEVTAYELTLFVSINVPVRPASMFISEVVAVTPSRILSSVAEAVTEEPAIKSVEILADPPTFSMYPELAVVPIPTNVPLS